MGDQDKKPRSMRSVISTFSLRDVAVVAVAAFTAAGPFFAYDTRISVLESKVESMTALEVEIKQALKEIARDQYDHLKEHEETARDQLNEDPPPPAPQKKGR